eukprot:GDKJ01014205.1.p1 GENE.GDKJ01014205.1~~GDKJ01014205.1.p1  ORF type:complete len:316 (+),score=41.66 GDKJ01014205.1:27-974(+)
MELPFKTDPSDHAETPIEAYKDALPVLNYLKDSIGSKFTVYDPFYCDGATIKLLKSLGIENTINKPEDFWERAKSKKGLPEHDVLVTNPPFSGDNIPKLLNFLLEIESPFCVLLPRWVVTKKYWHDLAPEFKETIFFCGSTTKAYEFSAPVCLTNELRGSNDGSSHNSVRSGYFDCLWFCSLRKSRKKTEKRLKEIRFLEYVETSKVVDTDVRMGWLGRPLKLPTPKPETIENNKFSGKDQNNIVFDSDDEEVTKETSQGAAFSWNVKAIPCLTIKPKMTPAERRWRKRQRLEEKASDPLEQDASKRQKCFSSDD